MIIKPGFKSVFVMSMTRYGQSCIYDDKESLTIELEEFDFTEDDIEYVFDTLDRNNFDKWINFECSESASIWIKKSLMSDEELSNLPEFNGW